MENVESRVVGGAPSVSSASPLSVLLAHVDSVEGESPGEEFVFASTGPHKVYTVLAHPVEPWKRANGDPQSAWTLALDHACEWAKGATTENAALAAVTRNLFYSCGWRYNGTWKLFTCGLCQ